MLFCGYGAESDKRIRIVLIRVPENPQFHSNCVLEATQHLSPARVTVVLSDSLRQEDDYWSGVVSGLDVMPQPARVDIQPLTPKGGALAAVRLIGPGEASTEDCLTTPDVIASDAQGVCTEAGMREPIAFINSLLDQKNFALVLENLTVLEQCLPKGAGLTTEGGSHAIAELLLPHSSHPTFAAWIEKNGEHIRKLENCPAWLKHLLACVTEANKKTSIDEMLRRYKEICSTMRELELYPDSGDKSDLQLESRKLPFKIKLALAHELKSNEDFWAINPEGLKALPLYVEVMGADGLDLLSYGETFAIVEMQSWLLQGDASQEASERRIATLRQIVSGKQILNNQQVLHKVPELIRTAYGTANPFCVRDMLGVLLEGDRQFIGASRDGLPPEEILGALLESLAFDSSEAAIALRQIILGLANYQKSFNTPLSITMHNAYWRSQHGPSLALKSSVGDRIADCFSFPSNLDPHDVFDGLCCPPGMEENVWKSVLSRGGTRFDEWEVFLAGDLGETATQLRTLFAGEIETLISSAVRLYQMSGFEINWHVIASHGEISPLVARFVESIFGPRKAFAAWKSRGGS